MTPSRFASALLMGQRSGPPPPLVRFLATFGRAPILAIAVQRRALRKPLEHTLDTLTIGEWSHAKRSEGLVRLFHARILLVLGPTRHRRSSNRWRAVLEKRPVVQLGEEGADHDWTTDARTTQTLWLASRLRILPTSLAPTRPQSAPPSAEPHEDSTGAQRSTAAQRSMSAVGSDLATFVMGAAARVGPGRFWEYDARDNNCQHFVSLVLAAWGLLTPELRQWIEQPVANLLGRFSTRAWTTLAAEAAARTDVALHGCDSRSPSCVRPLVRSFVPLTDLVPAQRKRPRRPPASPSSPSIQ